MKTVQMIIINDANVAYVCNQIEFCFIKIENWFEALSIVSNLQWALRVKQNITLDAEKDREIALTFHNIALCQIRLHKYDKARTNLEQALKIK